MRGDILYIAEVIGAGEAAISDDRATDPDPHEPAQARDHAHVGGLLSKKTGITHFHVGEREKGLALLFTLLDDYDVEPFWFYPPDFQRNESLLAAAIALARRGSTVDIDTVENDLSRWLPFYVERGGELSHLTISSDTSITNPRHIHEQLTTCIRDHGFLLEQILPLVEGLDADVLLIERPPFV